MQDFRHVDWGFRTPNHMETTVTDLGYQFENYLISNLSVLDSLVGERTMPVNNEQNEISFKVEDYKQSGLKSDCDTEDINSDELNFLLRKRNFEILSKKMKFYMANSYKNLRGRDSQFYSYVKKIEKLARKHGIDEHAFEQFSKLIKNEQEKNEILKQRKSRRFEVEYATSQEYKDKFFKLFNKGEHDEEVFKKFAEEDLLVIMRKFNSRVDSYFKKRSEPEDLSSMFSQNPRNKEYIEDYVFLRFAKLMKKLKEGYLYNLTDGKADNSNNKADIEELALKAKADYYKVLDNNIFDQDLLYTANNKFFADKGLHIQFYNKVNEVLVKSKTFKKFQDRLFIKDSQVEDIYNLNDDVIEGICNELELILSKNYEMNDLFDDKSKELKTPVKKSKEITKRIDSLKQKYKGEFDLSLDELSPDAEKREDLANLKQEYQHELVINSKLEEKFKNCYRTYINKKINNSTSSDKKKLKARANEDSEKQRKAFTEVFNQILADIELEKKGEKEAYQPNIDTEEDERYYNIRKNIETEVYGNSVSHFNYEGIYVDTGIFALDNTPVIYRKDKPFEPNPPKELPPDEAEILRINNAKRFMSSNINYSLARSFKIDHLKLEHIRERFEEMFGSSSDIIYPEGFKHLKSMDDYRTFRPEASLQDYQEEVNRYCDFETFALIHYGIAENFQKLFLLGLEFPELSSNLGWLNIYLRTKSTSFFVQLKSQYENFLKICQAKVLTGSVLDALYIYSNINYVKLACPQLEGKIKKNRFEIDVMEPIPEKVYDRLPRFKGEDNLMEISPNALKINPYKIEEDNQRGLSLRIEKTGTKSYRRIQYRSLHKFKYGKKYI
eukprot:CAMPEP_0170519950 /NCGR_PEP_ID=MMETSP0209-20121228/5170_1 /TAXON_ID=665100 ORGANISM="Litonotus pictus, Strain P1" /NCGR_SAMPLE_ID=MMETSP0209 /ASSEMBLY_ACC=CAM_ASM_000301 /LENGTH=838 /DNA_ID=CAMNT_0010805953 /DNA_START=315 /DNA_END=2831 /DNA_ORIENTATION=+